MKIEPKAMLVDITRCIGCHACEQTCKQVHGFNQETEPVLSATALTVVEERSGKFVRRLCMHCEDPSCVSVCPVGALQKTGLGPVVYDASKCIGCRYCMLGCPFNVPRYEWTKLAPYVKKCDLCYDRVSQGRLPACVEACPVGAVVFGAREEMLQEAHRRIHDHPSYVHTIYGSEEVGGTSVLFISDVPFEKLGFVSAPQTQPMPVLTASALAEVPTVVMVGCGVLSALYWITQRRQQVAAAEPTGSDKDSDKERS